MHRILLLFLITLNLGVLGGCVQPMDPFTGQKEVASDKAPADEASEELPPAPEPKGTVPRETEAAAPPKTDISPRTLFEDARSGAEDTIAVRRTLEGAFEPTLADAVPKIEPLQPVAAANPGPIEPKSDTTAANDWNSKDRYRAFYGIGLSKEAPREGDPALIFLNKDGTLTLKLYCEKCFKDQPGDCEGDVGWYACPKDTSACSLFLPEDYPASTFSLSAVKITALEGPAPAPNLTLENMKLGKGTLFLNDCNLLTGQTIGFFTLTAPPDFRVLKDYIPPPVRINPEILRNPEVRREILRSTP